MDSTDIYGIFMGSVILLLLISSFSYSIAQLVYNHIRRFFLRQIYFSLLPRWLGGCLRVSRYCGLLMIIYVNANVCLLVVDMKDGSDFTRRLGRAALINLVPLCAGGRFNQIAHVLSSRPDNYLTLHKCIGLVFIIEASLHSILSWLRGDIDLRSWPDKAGLVVSVLHILYQVDGFSKPLALRSFSGTNDLKAASSVGALVLLSIPVLWKWMYEPLSILHLALSATMITSLWFHLPSASITQIPRLYLILAISIFALIKLIFFLKLLFLNVSTELISTATIQQVGENGIEVRVTMPRPLRFRAGQFVFLSIPRLALFQYHPFQVAWEYLSDKSDGGRQVIVIIIQPRHGFTSRLRLAVPFKRYTALVEGPYGNPTKLDQYGTVLLFATGIGIAGQLPYMNEQLRLYREWRTKTRRHVLYWEIDAEEYRYWVNEWINEILSWNIDYDIQLYIRGRFLAKDAERGISVKKGEKLKRLTLNYDTMDPQSLLGDEIQRRKSGSRMLVSLCTDPNTAQAVTKIVRPLLGDDLDLVELDFCPWPESRRRKSSPTEEKI